MEYPKEAARLAAESEESLLVLVVGIVDDCTGTEVGWIMKS
jgi:hypothetical protein